MITQARSLLPLAALLGVVLAGASCSADDAADSPGAADAAAGAGAASSPAPSAATPRTDVPLDDGAEVIAPGGPGEPAVTGPVDPVDPAPWNDADTAFVQMMVPHHAQALEMSELARLHAVDPAVRSLAARISAAQGPEIVTMSSWLAERGLDAGADGSQMDGMDMDGAGGTDGTDGSAMAGMLSPDQLATLAAARGAAFDRLFVEGMIGHHQGAVEMASDVSVAGSDVRVAEMAADVDLTQSAEIARMQEMLTTLPR